MPDIINQPIGFAGSFLRKTMPQFKFAVRDDLKEIAEKFLPNRGEPYATGWDVFAAMSDRQDLVIKAGQYFKIPLGFRTIPPDGWWFQLHPRSSSFFKKHMHVLIGIVDQDFASELHLLGQYQLDLSNSFTTENREQKLTIKFGEAIGQIIPCKRVEMDILSISNEEFDQLHNEKKSIRNGGIGSTRP